MELVAFVLRERREELLVELARQSAQLGERLATRSGHVHYMPPAVVLVASPLDQPGLFELVEQADELSAVVAERIRDRTLRLA